jgi:hypothetical protein
LDKYCSRSPVPVSLLEFARYHAILELFKPYGVSFKDGIQGLIYQKKRSLTEHKKTPYSCVIVFDRAKAPSLILVSSSRLPQPKTTAELLELCEQNISEADLYRIESTGDIAAASFFHEGSGDKVKDFQAFGMSVARVVRTECFRLMQRSIRAIMTQEVSFLDGPQMYIFLLYTGCGLRVR